MAVVELVREEVGAAPDGDRPVRFRRVERDDALAIGGAAGGGFVSLAAPKIFTELYELPVGMLVTLVVLGFGTAVATGAFTGSLFQPFPTAFYALSKTLTVILSAKWEPSATTQSHLSSKFFKESKKSWEDESKKD